ncbi:MAG: ASKHA domain-containing protein [Candidatus Bathyarchaeia archaeon]
MTVRVFLKPLNREIHAEKGSMLLEILRDAGIRIESLCGGRGKCGRCRVIYEKGEIEDLSEGIDKFFSEKEQREGYHLACMIKVLSDCTFTIPIESRIESPKILSNAMWELDRIKPSSMKYFIKIDRRKLPLFLQHRSLRIEGYSGIQPRISDEIYDAVDRMACERCVATITVTPGFPEIMKIEQGGSLDINYGLAVDVGTTTIVVMLVDLNTGRVLRQGSDMNMQITYGEELVTRISYASEDRGLRKLQSLTVNTINGIIDRLTSEEGVKKSDITDCCIGANTVMNHLLAGIDPTYLNEVNANVSREPIIMKAKNIGLNIHPEAYLYCVPNVSRFLGGDAVGDVIASGMHESEDISLLVDLGTNGEIIFGNRSWLYSCSCASGPAFEGEGVKYGIRGSRGGIDHVKIDPSSFNAEVSVIDDTLPRGICGSGIIDVVAEMFKVGILDFVGKLVPGKTPLVREGRNGMEYVVVPAEKTSINEDIVITQADLDYIMDSKAATCGSITVLMKKLKLDIYDVKHFYLAGAFGTYTDLKNAVSLGIFPEFPNAEIHPIGNGSLSGAYLTLLSMDKREEARRVAEKMEYVDLLVDVEFMEEYSNALYIPGNKKFFPSWSKK